MVSEKDVETVSLLQESVRAAFTVAKGMLAKDEPDNKFLEKAHIHIHVPEACVGLTHN